nr:PP0621 family protein [Pseudomonas sp. RIT-PI-AD]
MFRLLFWVAIIAAALWFWRRLKAPRPAPSTPDTEPAEPMVRCTLCGVHLPRRHALPEHERWYCSQAHLRQDSATGER